MINRVKYRISIFLLLVLFFSESSFAQYMPFGVGYQSGLPQCPYDVLASGFNREEMAARRSLRRLDSRERRSQSKADRADDRIQRVRDRLSRTLNSLPFLASHVTNARSKSYYADCWGQAEEVRAGRVIPLGLRFKGPPNQTTIAAQCTGLATISDEAVRRQVSGALTDGGNMEVDMICSVLQKSNAEGSTDCASDLTEYIAALRDKKEAASSLSEIERQRDRNEDRIETARDRARERAERGLGYGGTEGGYCEDCFLGRDANSWLGTIANVGAGLFLGYQGRQFDRQAMQMNAMAGQPTTFSPGFPYYQAGIGSVINGLIGPGSYGCAGGLGGAGFPYGAGGGFGFGGSPFGPYGPGAAMGGAFGYPQNMYAPTMGGGMYMPGMNPNGVMNGPYGGMPFMPQYGLQAGFNPMMPGMMNPMMPGMMPGMMPQYGLQAGYNPMMPGMMPGMMNPMMPNFSNPFSMPPMMSPPMYGVSAGFNPYGGMMPPMMPGMSPGFGDPYGMNMSMQYQQQMMMQQQQMQYQQQMQMQQYYQYQQQMQMAQQQRQMMVYQQSSQIQTQIQQLQMQLQMLNMQGGGYGGGIYGGVGFGFGNNIGAPTPGGFQGGYPGMPYGGQPMPFQPMGNTGYPAFGNPYGTPIGTPVGTPIRGR